MKPDNFGKMVNVSLHQFSNASELGYGQWNYIRIANEIGKNWEKHELSQEVHIISKTRAKCRCALC